MTTNESIELWTRKRTIRRMVGLMLRLEMEGRYTDGAIVYEGLELLGLNWEAIRDLENEETKYLG